ncbi:MAG: gamma carbonic anhydrase family protein [Chloroflexi bacterium]|nr:gamma carbonic anhydrase family protein [Chloroflexota bacterium]
MLRSFRDKSPKVASTAFISEAAYIIGEVEVGEGSSIWPGVVVRGDGGPIRLGRHTNIQDNSVVHSASPMDIGDEVSLGHGVVVEARRLGNHVLIGNNATVLPGVEVGDYSIVAANSVVLSDTKIPPYSFVVGVPARVKGRVSEEQVARSQRTSDEYSKLAQAYKSEGL